MGVRPAAARAVRMRSLGEDRLETIRLQELKARTGAELQSVWAMLDALQIRRGARRGGRLTRVNAAYARAVEAEIPATPSRAASSFWSARRAT